MLQKEEVVLKGCFSPSWGKGGFCMYVSTRQCSSRGGERGEDNSLAGPGRGTVEAINILNRVGWFHNNGPIRPPKGGPGVSAHSQVGLVGMHVCFTTV